MDAAPKTPPAVITSLPKPIVKKDKDPAGKQ
jgi:hypothetical protein